MFDVTMHGAVARLSLNRPAARNAIPIAEWRALAARVAGLEGARVLILRSAVPETFCAGADLGDLATLAEDSAARAEFRLAMRAGLEALGSLPSIALVEGGCHGAGVALAMACDIRFASPSARFAITPAKLGLSYPQEDVSRLVALVGRGQAARLLFGARSIDGKEAARIGLVEVLDRNAAWLANELAEAIAANAPGSLAELRRAIRGESGDAGFDAAFAGADFAEGLAAFRAPRGRVPMTVESAVEIAGDPASGLLLIADHASNHIPAGIALGVPAAVMHQHVAIDIGVDPLARALCANLGCSGVLGGVSRLVIDLNREEDRPGLIPAESDGHPIPGNALDAAAREARIARFHRPYHARIAERIARDAPRLLLSLHSFTPRLASAPDPRPWQIGILYNRDERAARIAIPLLRAGGVVTGDNLPYSGKLLNATMNRHGEANGIAYLGIEVRQDLIGEAAGVAKWAGVLAPVIGAVRDRLSGD